MRGRQGGGEGGEGRRRTTGTTVSWDRSITSKKAASEAGTPTSLDKSPLAEGERKTTRDSNREYLLSLVRKEMSRQARSPVSEEEEEEIENEVFIVQKPPPEGAVGRALKKWATPEKPQGKWGGGWSGGVGGDASSESSNSPKDRDDDECYNIRAVKKRASGLGKRGTAPPTRTRWPPPKSRGWVNTQTETGEGCPACGSYVAALERRNEELERAVAHAHMSHGDCVLDISMPPRIGYEISGGGSKGPAAEAWGAGMLREEARSDDDTDEDVGDGRRGRRAAALGRGSPGFGRRWGMGGRGGSGVSEGEARMRRRLEELEEEVRGLRIEAKRGRRVVDAEEEEEEEEEEKGILRKGVGRGGHRGKSPEQRAGRVYPGQGLQGVKWAEERGNQSVEAVLARALRRSNQELLEEVRLSFDPPPKLHLLKRLTPMNRSKLFHGSSVPLSPWQFLFPLLSCFLNSRFVVKSLKHSATK